QRLVDLDLPLPRIEIAVVGDAPAGPRRPALHAVLLAHDNGDIEAYQRPDVGDALTVGTDDLHRLPHAAQRGHDLPDPTVAAAGIGIDLGQEPCLCSQID